MVSRINLYLNREYRQRTIPVGFIVFILKIVQIHGLVSASNCIQPLARPDFVV